MMSPSPLTPDQAEALAALPALTARVAALEAAIESPPAPTLRALLLTATAATIGEAFSATVSGYRPGSVLSLSGAGAEGLSISGATVSGTPMAAGPVDLVETMAGATNSPHTTGGAVTVGLATPTVRMVASHVAAPGDGGFGLSDGMATSQNYRSMHFNESGKTLTNLALIYSGWGLSPADGVEQDGPNPITVRAAIEFPAGTFTPVPFDGARDVAVGPSANVVSDSVSVSIPSGCQFWVRTFLTVNAGERWYLGYEPLTDAASNFPETNIEDRSVAAGNLETIEVGVGLTDKTTASVRIANTVGARAYGPSGIVSTDVGLRKPIAATGDGIIASGSLMDRRANGSYVGRACTTVRPYMQAAVADTTAQQQAVAGALSRRIDLWTKCGVDTVVTGYGHYDVGGGRGLEQIQADMRAVWSTVAGAGFKVIQPTVTPRTLSTDGWKTVANQTVCATHSGFVGGALSLRGQVNAWIRSLPAPLSDFFETADAVEPSRDDGRWLAAPAMSWRLGMSGSEHAASTADGRHPSMTSGGGRYAEYGGVYMLRDACSVQLEAGA